ncbi:hypothetical protein NA57DRAFT_57170 [Rhizodiscina lignyota]|uniref:Uncharacterized protein n=1 Tax=Rhizodiscina lignyota TaxID=1504668 RepID=A0A9P4IAH7_9PEZI|nr:hypothetical protein NA57DRAFT_57170 [Rhizodiscina lignyota]
MFMFVIYISIMIVFDRLETTIISLAESERQETLVARLATMRNSTPEATEQLDSVTKSVFEEILAKKLSVALFLEALKQWVKYEGGLARLEAQEHAALIFFTHHITNQYRARECEIRMLKRRESSGNPSQLSYKPSTLDLLLQNQEERLNISRGLMIGLDLRQEIRGKYLHEKQRAAKNLKDLAPAVESKLQRMCDLAQALSSLQTRRMDLGESYDNVNGRFKTLLEEVLHGSIDQANLENMGDEGADIRADTSDLHEGVTACKWDVDQLEQHRLDERIAEREERKGFKEAKGLYDAMEKRFDEANDEFESAKETGVEAILALEKAFDDLLVIFDGEV